MGWFNHHYIFTFTLPETNSSHLKLGRNPKSKGNDHLPNHRIIFPFPSIFTYKLAVSFRECIKGFIGPDPFPPVISERLQELKRALIAARLAGAPMDLIEQGWDGWKRRKRQDPGKGLTTRIRPVSHFVGLESHFFFFCFFLTVSWDPRGHWRRVDFFFPICGSVGRFRYI